MVGRPVDGGDAAEALLRPLSQHVVRRRGRRRRAARVPVRLPLPDVRRRGLRALRRRLARRPRIGGRAPAVRSASSSRSRREPSSAPSRRPPTSSPSRSTVRSASRWSGSTRTTTAGARPARSSCGGRREVRRGRRSARHAGDLPARRRRLQALPPPGRRDRDRCRDPARGRRPLRPGGAAPAAGRLGAGDGGGAAGGAVRRARLVGGRSPRSGARRGRAGTGHEGRAGGFDAAARPRRSAAHGCAPGDAPGADPAAARRPPPRAVGTRADAADGRPAHRRGLRPRTRGVVPARRALARLRARLPGATVGLRTGRRAGPVVLWWGERDRVCPPSIAHAYEQRLPAATLRLVDGTHQLLFGRWRDLLAELR